MTGQPMRTASPGPVPFASADLLLEFVHTHPDPRRAQDLLNDGTALVGWLTSHELSDGGTMIADADADAAADEDVQLLVVLPGLL